MLKGFELTTKAEMAHKRQEEGRENDATAQMAPGPSHVRAGSDSDVRSFL